VAITVAITVAISGHQRPSVAISGHQWPSAAIIKSAISSHHQPSSAIISHDQVGANLDQSYERLHVAHAARRLLREARVPRHLPNTASHQ
jgi:hypothetical protein